MKRYSEAIEAVSKSKKKPNLKKLDEFYSTAFREKYEKESRFAKEDLITLMTWKISRGKFRPLLRFVTKLTEEEIKSANEKLADVGESNFRIEDYISSVISLKGIGVATASAIMSSLFPEKFVFMSDEILQACSIERKYNIKQYVKLMESVKKIQQAHDTSEENLSLMDIEKAIWATTILSKD